MCPFVCSRYCTKKVNPNLKKKQSLLKHCVHSGHLPAQSSQ